MHGLIGWLIALAAVQPASGDTVKHSGTVVAVDPAAHVLVIAEVGRWRTEDGVTQLTRRAIALTPTTTYELYIRTPGRTSSGFRGDFLTFVLDASELAPGMFVTVACRHEGRQLIASGIAVVETPEP